MKQHTLILNFDENHNVVPVNADGGHSAESLVVEEGDEIRWTSPHGTTEIKFSADSPFAGNDVVKFDEFRKLSGSGKEYKYVCGVTTPDGKRHGWNMGSGATVIVGGSGNSGRNG